MGVIEAHDLKRTYRTTTGIFRRRSLEVEAVRGVTFEVARGRALRAARAERRRQDDHDQDADHAAAPDLRQRSRARARRRQRRARGAQADRLRVRRRPRPLRAPVRARQPPLLRRALRRPAACAANPDRRAARARRPTGREQERVEGYSRGMRQRLHIARGLLHDPAVVFLDEPTIGVDPVGARELRATIAPLVEAGKTVLLTTHYMFEADALCDRIAVIATGRDRRRGHAARTEGRVAEGGVVEIEVFGVPDGSVERLRAVGGVTRRRGRGARPGAGARRPDRAGPELTQRAPRRSSTGRASAASRRASRRSRTRTSRSSARRENPQAARARLAAPRQDDVAVGVRRVPRRALAALLRHRRVLHVPARARAARRSSTPRSAPR